MAEYMIAEPNVYIPAIPGLNFRFFRGGSDYPIIKRIFDRCKEVDPLEQTLNLEDIRHHFEHIINCDPYTDMIFAEIDGEPIGYSRVSWDQEGNGDYIYYTLGWILPQWRRQGIGTAILEWDERRLQEIAADHPADARKYYRTYIDDKLESHKALARSAGYQPVRYFFEMTRPIDAPLPEAPMPEGLEVRPVEDAHMPLIWEAMQEAFRDHWGYVEPTDESYQRWLTDPIHNPELWKVAWDGDRVAGMVLNHVDEETNKEFGRLRGWTEDICVRRPWRKRGLASALIVRSIEMFRERGFEETALGVDTENLSGALQLYQRIGYRTSDSMTTYQKPMA